MKAKDFMTTEQIAKLLAANPAPKAKVTKIPAPKMSAGEAQLALDLRVRGMPPGLPEFTFDVENGRGWKFDRAWPDAMVAIEIEGITYQGGRHQRFEGYQNDLDKYEAATLQGWLVYRCSPAMVFNGRAVDVLTTLLTGNTSKNTGIL